MQVHLDEIEWVIFDTETTGLDPSAGDRIVEIAALRFRGIERIATFQSLVHTPKSISAAAFAVNHINAAMLEHAPLPEEVIPRFLSFIPGAVVCSYNAGFDVDFLKHELSALGMALPEGVVVIDILRMARRLLPGLQRYALWFVAGHLGVQVKQEHRALSDVEMTFVVFQHLRMLLQEKGIENLTDLSSLFGLDTVTIDARTTQKIAQIQEAINDKAEILIRYFASSGEVSQRRVIPRNIITERTQSYLLGYCCLKKEERTFRIDRILHVELLS